MSNAGLRISFSPEVTEALREIMRRANLSTPQAALARGISDQRFLQRAQDGGWNVILAKPRSCREGRATERRAQPAGAGGWHAGSGRVAVSPVRALTAPGVPLPSGGSGDRPCGA